MTSDAAQARQQIKGFLERLAGHGMLRVALGAFVIGVFLHVCVVYAILDDGGGGAKANSSPGIITAPAAAAATATPSRSADRNSCDQIRGTDYRSDTERQWFLTNCRPVLP